MEVKFHIGNVVVASDLNLQETIDFEATSRPLYVYWHKRTTNQSFGLAPKLVTLRGYA
jgi:hypothetical protein